MPQSTLSYAAIYVWVLGAERLIWWVMNIFQLINCNCSAFDSRCFVCACQWLPGACNVYECAFDAFSCHRTRLRFRFCYWLPSIVFAIATFSVVFFFSFFIKCARSLKRTQTYCICFTRNLISAMSFLLRCRSQAHALAIYLQKAKRLHIIQQWWLRVIPFRTIIYGRKRNTLTKLTVSAKHKKLEAFWCETRTHSPSEFSSIFRNGNPLDRSAGNETQKWRKQFLWNEFTDKCRRR